MMRFLTMNHQPNIKITSMRYLSYLIFLSLFFFQACRQRSLVNENFSFNPDSSRDYSITLTKQSGASSEKVNMNLKLLRSVDSLYLLKLTFGGTRIVRPPVSIAIKGITKIYRLDILPSKQTSEDNTFQFIYYLRGLTKGQSLDIWINRKGSVLEVNGFEKLIDSVAVLSGSDKKEVRYLLKDEVGEKIFADNLNQLFSIAPNHKEALGDSWIRDITLTNKAPVKLSNMYAINKISGDSLFVKLSSSISGWASENATTPFMEGRGEGEIIVSKSTGVPYSYNFSTHTKTRIDSTINSESFFATVR